MLEARKMTTMAETRSAVATRLQANASQIYKPTSERDKSTSAILLLRTEFNEFKKEMRETMNTLLMSRQPYAGTQTVDEVKKENPDSDFKENSNILGAEGKKFALHLVPSGILNEDTTGVIGNEVVVHLPGLFNEIDGLESNGVSCKGRILVSDRAHPLFDFHQEVDGLRESELARSFIGTTKRGIGPCTEVLYAGLNKPGYVNGCATEIQCCHDNGKWEKLQQQWYHFPRPPELTFLYLQPWGQGCFGREDLMQELHTLFSVKVQALLKVQALFCVKCSVSFDHVIFLLSY